MRLPIVTLSLLLAANACSSAAADSAGSRASASAAASTAATAEVASFDPKEITPPMLALGDSLYHGLIGATSCQACHGADGKQATVAPDLTDAEWLHSDGSWEGIHTTVKSGVMAPKQFTSIMPPYGGAPLTLTQSRAVAAYVYSLGHPLS